MKYVRRTLWILLICAFTLAAEDVPSSVPQDSEEAPIPGAGNPKEDVKPYIASINVFGSSKIDEKGIRKLVGPKLDAWFKEGLEGDPHKAIAMQLEISDQIKKAYKLAFVDWSIIEYFQPGDLAIRVTLDVVEMADQKNRMPFGKPPQGKPGDPALLISSWKKYVDTAMKIANEGGLDPFGEECEMAFHCLFGHRHPELAEYGKQFAKAVNVHSAKLLEVAKTDQDPEARAAAVFLLAYLKDGNKVVSAMLECAKDPDPLVRNNALRVLGDIADLHPELVIPPAPILNALNFPTVTDRSKALYALYGMVDNSKTVREAVQKTGLAPLIVLLQSSQPNESEPAFAVLKRVSGQSFKKDEIAKWQAWATRLPAENIQKK